MVDHHDKLYGYVSEEHCVFYDDTLPNPRDLTPVVTFSDYAELEAQLAELEAENERLKQEIAATQEKLIRANDELIQRNSKGLASIGAVKVSREEAEKLCARLEYDASWDKCGSGYYSMKRQLSALEPAAPEGQQPVAIPVGWYLVPEVPTEDQMQAGLHQSSHDAKYADVCQSYMDMVRTPVDAPILFYPSEQAVTEAMEAAAHDAFHAFDKPGDWRGRMRAALKAAMEAGRHE